MEKSNFTFIETLTPQQLEEKIEKLKGFNVTSSLFFFYSYCSYLIFIDPNEPPIEFRIQSNLIVVCKIVDNCKKNKTVFIFFKYLFSFLNIFSWLLFNS